MNAREEEIERGGGGKEGLHVESVSAPIAARLAGRGSPTSPGAGPPIVGALEGCSDAIITLGGNRGRGSNRDGNRERERERERVTERVCVCNRERVTE